MYVGVISIIDIMAGDQHLVRQHMQLSLSKSPGNKEVMGK